MKTRLLPVVLFVSCLLPSLHLRAASDVSVSTALTSGGTFGGGNPNVFTPTAASAVANNGTIQTSLNAGSAVTVNTASATAGNGDLLIAAVVAKTAGASATLTLNALRDLAINFGLNSTVGTLPLNLTAGRASSSSASIASNGGNITINTVQPFTLGNSLNAGAGQILLQTGSLDSSAAQTVTASTVQVSAGAAWKQRGTVTGSLNVAGTVSPGAAGLASLAVTSTLTLQSIATTILNLGGTSQGTNYGAITTTGTVTLAGALQVDFANGFENTIVNGHTFTILTGASITGTFTGLPNNARITFPNELGSVKITYTATTVTLSDWQPYIRELTWDPGTADAGTQALTNTSTRAGRHYFHINTQATDIGAWKTRLTVTTGEAHLYLSQTAVPQTTASIPASRKSERTGSDGLILRSDEFAAGQDWYLLVNVPAAGAQWSLFTGRAWVQDLGTLAWTDTNSNSQYDIGEPALLSGSGNVNLGPEGIRFFKTIIPTGTPAWSLWLNGDPRDLAVRKNFVPFHTSTTYYDRRQSGQMLVVPTYLGTGAATYFLSVIGNPGDAVNLDSRIQEVSDIGFNTTVSNVAVSAAPYRVYRVQVPVEQIAWDVSTTALAGNPNVCVRRDNVPAEFDNDAYSEAAGSATDSVSMVPDKLTDGTWFITVYGTGSYTFTLFNGAPVITPLGYTDTKINDQPARAGWRFYALTDIPAQVGTLGWELLLSNQAPGTQIAIRRNKVPGRWQYRVNGSATVTDTNTTYFDFSGSNGFLQRPGHQADVWYVGIYLPQAPLGAFTLDVHPITPALVGFNGSTTAVASLEPGRWKYVRVDVPSPAGVLGWDVRVRDVSGGTPQLVVRRDQLPASVGTTWQPSNGPARQSTWPSGYQWSAGDSYYGGYPDWTRRAYEAGGSVDVNYQRLVMGIGRPLEPGTYYVGIYNVHATQATSYTFDSRGIGAGQTYPITDLAYAGGSTTVSNLAPREAKYFKVTIPANTPSWEVTLDPTMGEMMMAVRRGAVPDFELFRPFGYFNGGGWFANYDTPQADYSREIPQQKSGPERYVLLPRDGQDYLIAGDYYIAVIGEGQNPADASHVGTGNSSGVLTSRGPLGIAQLGAANAAGTTQAVSLAGGQVKAYQFTVPPGTPSLEVRLDNRVGNPLVSLVPGTRMPPARINYNSSYEYIYGFGDGQTTGGWASNASLITVPNPAAGTYSLVVYAAFGAGNAFPNASADLVVRQKPAVLLNFAASQNGNGQSNSDTRQAVDFEKNFYQVAVPANLDGQPVVGWLLKVNNLQGDTTLRIYKTWGDTNNAGITVTGNVAVIVPPFLTVGDTWYVEVQAIGLTNYMLTSEPVVLQRPVWVMPPDHNVTFGDSGNDSNGVPLPGDRGIDIGEDDWHFFAIDVPNGNAGLLRTELQAINGNPNLYIREDGVPTTDHDSNGGTSLTDGVNLAPRSLTATQSEYGNWVPLDGRTEKQLRPGRWYLGVKATGGTNARYRLIVSNGRVTDLALNGGSVTNQTLVGRDWRYYRFTVPADAPNNWNLTFSQQVGDVVMWLRDTIPPGNRGDGLEAIDAYNGLRSWYYDNKNQGPYYNSGYDAAGTYTLNTPPLRPGYTYYVGFKANNDATFSFSSSTSGGTIGVLPTLDFYTGTINTTIPANSSVLYQIPVPPEGTRMKWTSTHASTVQLRMEQGTLPATTGTAQHYYSTVANAAFNQPLSTASWPWQPSQTNYLRIVNTVATPAAVTLTMNGKNAQTEDEDNDRLPDAWELQYFPSISSYNATQDPDKDGLNNFLELAFNLDPTRSSVGALVPDTGTAGLPVAYLTQIGADVHLTLEFVRRRNAGMTYTVQFANAPGTANWQAAVNPPIVTPIDANWERVVVDDTATLGANRTRFGRVVVSKP